MSTEKAVTHGLKSLRQSGKLKSRDLYRARVTDLVVVPGQSGRTNEDTPEYQAGIEALAQYMRDGGKVPPIEIEVDPKTGDIKVIQGHRRRRAYMIVIPERVAEAQALKLSEEKIEDLKFVDCLPFTGSEMDKVARILSGNTHEAMTDLDIGAQYLRLQKQFNLNVSEISRVTGHPRFRVDTLLTLVNSAPELQEAVKAGDIKPTEAAKMAKKHGADAGAALAEKKAEAKAAGKKRVTSGVANGFSLPKPLVADLHTRVTNLVAKLPKPTLSTLKDYKKDPDQYDPDEFVQVPLAVLAGLTASHANVVESIKARDAKAKAAAKATSSTQQAVVEEDF